MERKRVIRVAICGANGLLHDYFSRRSAFIGRYNDCEAIPVFFNEIHIPPEIDALERVRDFRSHFFIGVEGASRRITTAYVLRNTVDSFPLTRSELYLGGMKLSAHTFAACSSAKAVVPEIIFRKVLRMLELPYEQDPADFRKWLTTMTPHSWKLPDRLRDPTNGTGKVVVAA